MSKELFRQKDDYASPFIEHLEKISTYCSKENITLPQNIQLLLSDLNKKATKFAMQINQEIEYGINPVGKETFNYKFYNENSKIYEELAKFFEQNPKTQSISKYFYNFKQTKYPMLYNHKICQISQNLDLRQQIYYHGEGKLTSNITDKRTSSCLGAGLYCTPHRDLAGSYAGINGKISHYKLCTNKIAIVNQEQILNVITKIVENLEKMNVKSNRNIVDAIITKLFTFNNYDAAYSIEDLSNFGNVKEFYDKLAHGKNAELAIFSQNGVQELNTNFVSKLHDKFSKIYGTLRKQILALFYN